MATAPSWTLIAGMGAGRRAQLAARLSADVRRLSRAGIRSRHPTYTDEDVEFALRRLLYGDDLVPPRVAGPPCSRHER